MSKFAERLKELRTEKGLPQIKFAKEIGYAQSIISAWEKGLYEPNANALIACATFFDVSTDYLLGLEREDGTKIRVHI